MSIEMVGYIFLGWLAIGVITALLLGRIMRETSGVPVPATAAMVRPMEQRAHRTPRRGAGGNGRRHAHRAA
jgi:hypothetical protein